MDKKAMHNLSYGLFVLTAHKDGFDNGCITNTAIQVTSEPNQIAIAVNKANLTHDMILETKKFNISIISEDAKFDLFKRFGFQSGRNINKFENYYYGKSALNDVMYINEGTNSYISVYVTNVVDLGSHSLFIGIVVNMVVLSNKKSATYEYYQNNIKPKPVELGKNNEGKTIWRCSVCGYEYVGEDIPDDFECPLCHHPKSDFEKINK